MDDSSGSRSGARTEPLAVSIVEAMAERAGVDATDLDRPLYDVIDPDALEELFPVDAAGRPRCEGRVSFAYDGFRVEVASDGEVWVTEPAADEWRARGRRND